MSNIPETIHNGWHWVDANWELRDGTPLEVGATYHVPNPALCERGLHWSREPLDALQYAPGPVCCYVQTWGETVHNSTKAVSEYRRVLWAYDATHVLHEFACRCAEHALRRKHVTDERSWAALTAKRAWMRGDITREELGAAHDAAQNAAWDAVRAPAQYAAQAAAQYAAQYAARDSARYAAQYAAREAVWDARTTRDDTRAAQNRLLRILLQEPLTTETGAYSDEGRPSLPTAD